MVIILGHCAWPWQGWLVDPGLPNPSATACWRSCSDFILFCFHRYSFGERVVRKESRMLDGDLAGWRGLGFLEMGVGKAVPGGKETVLQKCQAGKMQKACKAKCFCPPPTGFVLSFPKRALVSACYVLWVYCSKFLKQSWKVSIIFPILRKLRLSTLCKMMEPGFLFGSFDA